jgi:alpha-ribazole phosphatase
VTDQGIAACAARAAGIAHEALVCSDLRRARRSAEAIGTPAVDARWRELDFGEWDGLSPREVEPARMSAFWRDPNAHPPPGGERWSTLVDRVGAAIEALPAVPTLVVTHAGAMRAALGYLCGLDHAAGWALDLPYAAMLSVRVWPGGPRRGQVTGLRA